MVLLAIAGALTLGGRVWAEDTNAVDEISVLRQQIESLDQKVRILERQREVDRDTAAESAKESARTTPVITAGANGFSFQSADTNFVLALHGLLQLDSRSFFEDHGIKGNDGLSCAGRVRSCRERCSTTSIFFLCRILAAVWCRFRMRIGLPVQSGVAVGGGKIQITGRAGAIAE